MLVPGPRATLNDDEATLDEQPQCGLDRAPRASRLGGQLRDRIVTGTARLHRLGEDGEDSALALGVGGHDVERGEVATQAETPAFTLRLVPVRRALPPPGREDARPWSSATRPRITEGGPARKTAVDGGMQRFPSPLHKKAVAHQIVDARTQPLRLGGRADALDAIKECGDVGIAHHPTGTHLRISEVEPKAALRRSSCHWSSSVLA